MAATHLFLEPLQNLNKKKGLSVTQYFTLYLKYIVYTKVSQTGRQSYHNMSKCSNATNYVI